MTPEELAVISDLIKISVPSSITALVAYLTIRYQLKSKIVELKFTHEFSAKSKIFEYYKEKKPITTISSLE